MRVNEASEHGCHQDQERQKNRHTMRVEGGESTGRMEEQNDNRSSMV